MSAAEREQLLFFLNRLRAGLARTSEGLTDARARAPGVASGTNLLGLVSHLTAMETQWFRGVYLGEDVAVDATMALPATATREQVIREYQAACEGSNAIVLGVASLDQLSRGLGRLPASTAEDTPDDRPRQVTLREVIVHLIEETARHAGHADILREQIDGAVDL